MPDKDVHTCTRCLIIQFSLTVRKHHCRFCGFVVCNHCSKHKLYSQATGANERCCDPCMAKAELRPVSDEYRPSFMLPEVPARRSFSVEALEMTKNETVYLARVEHDNTVVSALPSQPRLIHPTIMPSDHPAGRPCGYLRPTNAVTQICKLPLSVVDFYHFYGGDFILFHPSLSELHCASVPVYVRLPSVPSWAPWRGGPPIRPCPSWHPAAALLPVAGSPPPLRQPAARPHGPVPRPHLRATGQSCRMAW